MKWLPSHAKDTLCTLIKYSSDAGRLEKAHRNTYEQFITDTNALYASGALENMYKVKKSHDFCHIMYYRFVNDYLNKNIRELTTFQSNSSCEGNIRLKTEEYRELEELILCLAKECSKIKNAHKFVFIDVKSLEGHVQEDTVLIYSYY